MKTKRKLLGSMGKNFNTNDVIAAYGHTAGLTCPMKGDCAKPCYADEKGRFAFPNVKDKRYWNFLQSKQDDFTTRIISEIVAKDVDVIRIHDGGDFYSPKYIEKWISIAANLPNVRFYAYTKTVSYFLGKKLPKNLIITYSFGGKEDHLIDTRKHRHCHVFKDAASLKRSGYLDVSKDDSLTCYKTRNKKIGIVYHGARTKLWYTKE